MDKNINLKIDDINIALTDRIVRVDNDENLKALLHTGKRAAALQLSTHIRQMYEKEFGKPLKISTKSLAAEIYDHYLIQEMTFKAERVIGKIRPTRWMVRHMEVIDCGEQAVDNNRFLWNLASIFWRA